MCVKIEFKVEINVYNVLECLKFIKYEVKLYLY